MLKTIYLIAALLAVGLVSPAFAADKMDCDQASMSKMDTDMMKMKDGEDKTMAMNEMKMAQDMMMKKDMNGCMDHMDKAMKAMGH